MYTKKLKVFKLQFVTRTLNKYSITSILFRTKMLFYRKKNNHIINKERFKLFLHQYVFNPIFLKTLINNITLLLLLQFETGLFIKFIAKNI